jgi:hypothetical protein
MGRDPLAYETLERILAGTARRIEGQDQALRPIDTNDHFVVRDRSGANHGFGQANQHRTPAVDLSDQILERSRNDERFETFAARDIPERDRPHTSIGRRSQRSHLIDGRGNAEMSEHHGERGWPAIVGRFLWDERDT